MVHANCKTVHKHNHLLSDPIRLDPEDTVKEEASMETDTARGQL